MIGSVKEREKLDFPSLLLFVKKKWANKYLANDLGLKPTSFNLFSKDLPAYALLLVREDKIHDSIFGPHPSTSALSYKALFQTFEDAPLEVEVAVFLALCHCYILPCNNNSNVGNCIFFISSLKDQGGCPSCS